MRHERNIVKNEIYVLIEGQDIDEKYVSFANIGLETEYISGNQSLLQLLSKLQEPVFS